MLHVTINVDAEPSHDVLGQARGEPFIVLGLGELRLILSGYGLHAATYARTIAQTLVLAAEECERIAETLPPTVAAADEEVF